MASTPKPSAEVAIDAALVARLLRAQHPDLADQPLRHLASGWDNVNFRLGDRYVVRLPRREVAAALVAHEQRWLPVLAADLPLPIAAPLSGLAAFTFEPRPARSAWPSAPRCPA